jgi:hydroxymethylbilane synthase
MVSVLTVATRPSDLATTQTNIVVDQLRKAHPEIEFKVKTITTTGDTDSKTALWNLKSTGFFTSQLENALLANQADIAIHSFKDLPTQQPDGLIVAAITERKPPEDCLLTSEPITSIDQLPNAAKIGTSSLRRTAQIKHVRPDVTTEPIRGNVATRIRKLDDGEFDAIILAHAGLLRLSLEDRISICFDPVEFIPAPAQGALAVQTRTDDATAIEVTAAVNHRDTAITAKAERRILSVTKCGCHAPVGAYAMIQGDTIEIIAFIANPDGTNFIRRSSTGLIDNATILADDLAHQILSAGGRQILDNLESR